MRSGARERNNPHRNASAAHVGSERQLFSPRDRAGRGGSRSEERKVAGILKKGSDGPRRGGADARAVVAGSPGDPGSQGSPGGGANSSGRAQGAERRPLSTISRARAKVESAKLALHGNPVGANAGAGDHERSASSSAGGPGGQRSEDPTAEGASGGATDGVVRRPGGAPLRPNLRNSEKETAGQQSAAEKLRKMQAKRQQQRLNAVRNWNDRGDS